VQISNNNKKLQVKKKTKVEFDSPKAERYAGRASQAKQQTKRGDSSAYRSKREFLVYEGELLYTPSDASHQRDKLVEIGSSPPSDQGTTDND
jgi:hypothetical protein